MRLLSACALIATLFASPFLTAATTIPPRPDHVVIVIEENKINTSIIGNPAAPYINSLAQAGALFTNSFGVTHPSQPNYLAFFSGSTQGIFDNSTYPPINAPNLGGELIAKGLSFIGYSEDLPFAGFNGDSAGSYWRKHNPWVNFPDVPVSSNLPFTDFPSDFSLLPTVSIVVPNQQDDMHDGTIQMGDTWLKNHLDAYAQWAMTHNSLLIVTFDESDTQVSNQISTIFYGPMVIPGNYSEHITHYTVLRTLLEMYRLAPMAESAKVGPILDVWTQTLTSPELTTNGIVTADVGKPFSVDIPFTGSDPVVLSATGLPGFLTLNGKTLSGVPDTVATFTFQISATNYAGSQSVEFTLTVRPHSHSNDDSDGDGFPDEIEDYLGTDPLSMASTPLGGSPANEQAMRSGRLAITLNFASQFRDKLVLTGGLPMNSSGPLAGQKILIDVGGIFETFELNPAGVGANQDGRFHLTASNRAGAYAPFRLQLSRAKLGPQLSDDGLADMETKHQLLSVPVYIYFNSTLYKAVLPQIYSARLHHIGRTK